MNKLLVSDNIDLNSGNYILEFDKEDITLKINGIVKLYCYNENLHNLNIEILENSEVQIFYFHNHISKELSININQINDSKVTFNASFINDDKFKLNVNNNILSNNNESTINIRNISKKDVCEMVVNEFVENHSVNNIVLEDLKGIMDGGFVHIEPNIICKTNEVTANHLTTIGGIDIDSMNYLLSKGINEKLAKELLLKGFIYSNMDELFKENWEVN